MLNLRSETLRAFYDDHYKPLRLRGRSPETFRLYEVTFRALAVFLGREALLSDLTDETVSKFAAWRQAAGVSIATVNRDLCSVLALWRFACRMKREPDGAPIVGDWPTVREAPEPQDDPLAWNEDELRRLFDQIRRVPGTIAGIPACRWWAALHFTLWDSAERVGAILAARWTWLDLQDGWLRVPATARKGKRKGKTFRLHPTTIAALKAIQKPPRELVFPWDQTPTYLWQRYASDILAPAGLDCGRKSKFHRMRKTVASFAEAGGLDATRLLGHSARRVTERYLDPRLVREKSPAELPFRPDGKGKTKAKPAAIDAAAPALALNAVAIRDAVRQAVKEMLGEAVRDALASPTSEVA